MGSFKAFGRNRGPEGRKGQKNPKRQGLPRIEFLESRRLLSTGSNPPGHWTATDTNLFDAQNGPMANLGTGLVGVYQTFVDTEGNSSQLATEFPEYQFEDGMVGVQLKSLDGDFSDYLTQLTDVGMQITDSSTAYDLVDGYAPVNELPTIAELPLTANGQVAYKAIVYAANTSLYQGVAYNESETAMQADIARTEYNVDGTGVTIGALSDSVNQYTAPGATVGGLAASYATLDLNPDDPVDVIQDDASQATDEGRAMLENIHDVAPGANLQFATGDLSELSMMQNIEALQAAGSQIIVDDIGYPDEPMFQDGLIAQGVDAVTQLGATYFSAAGNEGLDSGYLSTFRGASGTVAGVGSGTFMNFAPTGASNFLLPVSTGINNAEISFEYDQPFGTQQPVGSTAAVTSNLDFYVLNASGTVVASGTTNNVATDEPLQIVTVPTAGTYYVAIQLVSGSAPGHVEFVGQNDTNGAVTVSTEYGSADGTSYPSSFGHATAADTIGVGATPWWAPASSLGIGQNPLANEPFSSPGPALYVFNANGTALATPETVDNPSITAPDGGNTSFFSSFPSGYVLDTSNPPIPGQPASSVNLTPANQQAAVPFYFFGTSSAAPNAAAVAALMLEKIPQLTPAEIRQGLEESALPMNGTAAGTWNPQSGYGEVDAVAAINAVDLLRVASTNPANGATVTVSPSAVTVTFNKAVNFSTITAADLTFTSTPTGVKVNVGTPIAVDNPTSPTIVQFPISFTKPAGTLANGSYTFSIQSPAAGPIVQSTDGKDLVGSGPIKFTLADVTAPTVINTTTNGRIVQIFFSKAIDPNTVNLNDIFVIRQGTNPIWPPTQADVLNYTNLNSDPRTKISYSVVTNPTTGALSYVVTLDYTALPQTELPTDNYAIVVLSTPGGTGGVTDLVGNPLNGGFSGSFPSGSTGTPQDFIQNLGTQKVVAPTITSFALLATAANDTGIVGDQNTNISEPELVGQLYAAFPNTVANLPVYVEFSGLHGGVITLAAGSGGRGFVGTYDVEVTTNSVGTFTVIPTTALPEGFQEAAAVVVGEPDAPPLPGYSDAYDDNFRIDKTAPQITGATLTVGGDALPLPNGPQPNYTAISALTNLYLNVVDPVNPYSSVSNPPFQTPSLVVFSALNPITAENISNYSLINTTLGNVNESSYIATATFTAGPEVTGGSGPYVEEYTGTISLTFSAGLPAGVYEFVAHTTELQYPGLTDAAGNPLDDTPVVGEGTKDFVVNFDIQPTPVYITNMAFESTYSANGSTAIGGPQSFYELPPTGGTNTRDNVSAPPTAVVIDFSNPLPYLGADGYQNDVQLIGSTNPNNTQADGDFGNLGQGGLGSTDPASGFTVLSSDYTVTLYNYTYDASTGAYTSTLVQTGQTGNRLVLQLNAGFTLPADNYRIYMPNQVNTVGNTSIDTRVFDIYGNQLDGEFLGNQTSTLDDGEFPTLPQYEDLQSDGTNRMDDLSGDGAPGGAFLTAFEVVNYGNVVYANPSFVENPLSGVFSNGSMAAPYPVLAPEGDPNSSLADNTDHDPNGGLNNEAFFQQSNFNVSYDRSGDGQFEQSALYAAEQLSYAESNSDPDFPPQLGGPVVIVAEAGLPQRNPVTGVISTASFVLQAPAGSNSTINNGSASVPFDTTLVFQAGSVLKLQNASLYVQNQGSALQVQGTNSNQVFFTSYNDASSAVGGPSNGNPDTTPHAGDWGGIVFRNYDEQNPGNYTASTDSPSFPVDDTLKGPNSTLAVSGADAAMSILNFVNIRYAGGAVPQGSSNFYSAVTLYASRPTISNSNISDSGGTGGTEAAIGADFDSFIEDDTARGPLIRQVSVTDNSLNGIWLMSQSNGLIEPTNAMPYPTNPATLGGSENYALDDPLPFVVLAQVIIGQEQLVNTGGITDWIGDRLYIDSGNMIKFGKGSGLQVLNPDSSLNVGSRSYITGFDADNQYNPLSVNDDDQNIFVQESASDPKVLFTTIFDDDATTPLVPDPINVTGETTTPTLTSAMWGSVGIQSGAVTVINAATFQYGGGTVNTTNISIPSQSVLAFITNQEFFPVAPATDDNLIDGLSDLGTRAYITNNNFFDNFDAAMQIEPNGLLAGNPLTPLFSGHPFFRGNVLQGNGIDGLAVVTARSYLDDKATDYQYVGPVEAIGAAGYVNQTVSTVWDLTDITYVLRGTVVLDGAYGRNGFFDESTTNLQAPVPNLTTYTAVPNAVLSLTIESALPGTLLADGTTVPSPGQSVVVKLLSDSVPNGAGSFATDGSTGVEADENAGAGFVVGVDDGVDPPSSPLVDPGAYSEIRILGIPGNQTTGQQRVPVIFTSLRDDSIGVTARGVTEDDIFNSWPTQDYLPGLAGNPDYPDQTLTTPEPGDGGYIYIGGNSMTEYDPTNPLISGSFIDNADMYYMTRIEVQGAGITDVYDPEGTTTLTAEEWLAEKTGYGYLAPLLAQGFGFIGPGELTDPNAAVSQLNSAMAFTIDDSNLANFADAAVFVHPGAADGLERDWTANIADPSLRAPFPARSSFDGQGVDLYMYNDVIYNNVPKYTPPGTTVPTPVPYAQGVHINSESADNTAGETAYSAVLLNDTFYQTTYAVQTIAPEYATDNSNSSVNTLAMNDIFDGSNVYAVDIEGQASFSLLQYNLFYNNINTTTTPLSLGNVNATTNIGDFPGNQNAIFGNPDFVDPSSGNFELQPDSPAIDAARSEIGPLPASNAIYPTVNQTFLGQTVSGVRTDPTTVTDPEQPGRINIESGLGNITDPRQLVTLPGSGDFTFSDEWDPVLVTNADGSSNTSGYASTGALPGWYNYQPITGQRDILGYIRSPQATNPGAGYGSNPFIDIGAYQYVNLHPPEVTDVREVPSAGAPDQEFYTVGGVSGDNTTPWQINVYFNGPLDPNTVNSNTVKLVNLGSNPSQPLDQDINLSGKLSYSSIVSATGSTQYILTINLAASGLTLSTDAYQITLFGSGSPVLASPQGVALDGENTVGAVSTGAQLALPSGNGYPGGNFFDSFIINTTPPSVQAGSFKLDPASDTNIVGDNITSDTSPTFDGTIVEPNPQLVPLAGQTAYLDIGIALVYNGVLTDYFSASSLPASLAQYAQYIRPDAATAVTSATGTFQDTVGIDGAATGLVTNNTPLPNLQNLPYNVGVDGLLSPLPGDDSGFYIARVRVVDQSGNQSNLSDPNAQVPLVVDTTPPTVSITAPQANEVISSLTDGQIQFTIDTNENIDLTTLTAASIQVINAGPDGILGTADDVTIPINPSSFQVTYLDKGTGGLGAEQITFTTQGTLTNNLYQVTLVDTPANGIRDIAGNVITSPVTTQFLVDVPALSTNLFVGAASYVTNDNAPIGDRANPYPTISAAMTAATAGDVVAVLPGVYTEQVTLKQFVKLYSAAASSTDATVFTTSTGDPLSTIIRAPYGGSSTTGTYDTVTATDLQSFAAFSTEIAGFTIASSLLDDPAQGTIDPNSVGLAVTNSSLNIDKDYFIDAGVGIQVTTSGASALTPSIYNDAIIGNLEGAEIVDGGSTASTTSPVDLINNTFAFNTIGLYLSNSTTTPLQAVVDSNIFWENHDQTNARNGYAIYSTNPNEATLRNNLFSGNGASETSQANATNDLGNGFSPALLGPLAANAASNLGNFTGSPAFAYPIDPRPGSDGPANFFLSADYELTSASAAIDNAWEATAITTDLLGNSQIKISGDGFGLPGYGPRDVGAFEFQGGSSPNPVGGEFRVVTTSLVPNTGAAYADGSTLTASSAPSNVVVTFSGNVNPQDIAATDLVLSGSAIDSLNPVHATSLTWIDAHTVEFNLAGQFNSTGTINVEVLPGSITGATGTTNPGYSDNVVLQIVTPVAPVVTTPTPVSSPVTTTTTPTPAAAPTGGHKTKGHAVVKHPAKHVVIHPKTTKHVVVKQHKPAPKVVVHHPVVKKK